MELQEIRPGLWRWTARHPEWQAGAEPESPADWPPDVGSVAHARDSTLALIDPLVPDDGWETLDGVVGDHRVAVLTTLGFHRRSRDAVLARYRGTRDLPAGVEPVRLRGFGETMYWLPEHRALVPGDRLLGAGDGTLRLCPESWLGYLSRTPTLDELREALRAVLVLPVELVLVSHGEPVLAGGREAIAGALEA